MSFQEPSCHQSSSEPHWGLLGTSATSSPPLSSVLSLVWGFAEDCVSIYLITWIISHHASATIHTPFQSPSRPDPFTALQLICYRLPIARRPCGLDSWSSYTASSPALGSFCCLWPLPGSHSSWLSQGPSFLPFKYLKVTPSQKLPQSLPLPSPHFSLPDIFILCVFILTRTPHSSR